MLPIDASTPLRFAARAADVSRVRVLTLQQEPLSEALLGMLVREACGEGDLSHTARAKEKECVAVVDFLLSLGAAISQNDLRIAVCNASDRGHVGVLKQLLSEGRTLPDDDLEHARKSAEREGHSKITRFLNEKLGRL